MLRDASLSGSGCEYFQPGFKGRKKIWKPGLKGHRNCWWGKVYGETYPSFSYFSGWNSFLFLRFREKIQLLSLLTLQEHSNDPQMAYSLLTLHQHSNDPQMAHSLLTYSLNRKVSSPACISTTIRRTSASQYHKGQICWPTISLKPLIILYRNKVQRWAPIMPRGVSISWQLKVLHSDGTDHSLLTERSITFNSMHIKCKQYYVITSVYKQYTEENSIIKNYLFKLIDIP